jgi:hypothetical protein
MRRLTTRVFPLITAAILTATLTGCSNGSPTRPPATPSTTSSVAETSPTQTAASDETVVQLATGEKLRVSDTNWILNNRWGIDFRSPAASGEIGFIMIYGATNAQSEDCFAAASCAEAFADGTEGKVTEEAVGDLTYYRVDGATNPPVWYVDREGHVYQLSAGSRQVENLLESVDWTGTRGTVAYLPTGVRIGLDVPKDWEIADSIIQFARVGGDPYDGPTVGFHPSCSSAAMCATEASQDTERTYAGTRTVNGVTYHLVTGGVAQHIERPEVWYFDVNDHVYAFGGDSTWLSAFVESVEWID